MNKTPRTAVRTLSKWTDATAKVRSLHGDLKGALTGGSMVTSENVLGSKSSKAALGGTSDSLLRAP